MLRHAAIAILLFLGIAALAYFLAQQPEAPTPQPSPPPVAAPEVAARLLPSGDFLPRASLPEMTVEAQLPKLVARFYRVTDSALLLRLYRGAVQDSLSSLAVARLLDDNVKPIHVTELTVKSGRAKLAWDGVAATAPGFYAVTLAASPRAPAFAASWFMRNDLLILAAEDREQWHVLCQDMASGAPRSDIKLTWLGLDNAAPLAQADCGATGHLSLAKSALEQNSVPLLLWAQDQRGQLAFVPLRTVRLPPDDRKTTQNLLITDRPHYLAGQTVQVMAARLEEKAENLRFDLIRPDGLQIAEAHPTELRAGVGWGRFVLPSGAMPGRWRVVTHGKDSVVHEVAFQVEEDVPLGQSRLKLVARDDARVTVAPQLLDARGLVLSDQAASITLRWEPVRFFPELADGYAFGGLDTAAGEPMKLANLVVKSGSTVALTLPPPPKTDTPMQARLELQPLGLPAVAAQPLLVRFPPTPWALGIKATFAPDSLRGNSQAGFRVSLLPTVKKAAKAVLPPVHYELLTERRSFRWFFADGSWRYETDVATVAPVFSGSVTLGEDRSGTVNLSVQPGQYRLETFTPDRKLLTSWRFSVTPAVDAPPVRHLPVAVKREDAGKIKLSPLVPEMRMALAADQKIQEIVLAMPGAEAQLAAELPQGGHVAAVGVDRDEAGAWRLTGTRHWLPPQTHPDLRAVDFVLPDKIIAGSAVPLTLNLPPTEKRERFVQLVAVPLTAKVPARPLLQNLLGERAVAFAIASNIPADWPEALAPETTRQPPTLGESRSSPVMPVPDDGRVVLALPMPLAEKVALHLLIWDETMMGEKLQELALLPATPAGIAPTPAPAVTSITLLPPAWHFSCSAPLANGQNNLLNPPHDKTLASPAVLLSPLPVPDVGRMLAQLWAANTNRSDVLARSLLALQSYRALLEIMGVKPAQFAVWQTRILAQLMERQRGDGGIALYADAPLSDLTASAFTLLAWHAMPDEAQAPERQRALLEHVVRRLDVAWGAETELYARSDAFYALGVLGKIDPAALRYFVEKYGNTIRHAVFEAELAAALASIGDKQQSQQFALRASAQLPAMRVEQPQNALQVLQILVHHDLVQPQEAVALLPDVSLLSSARLTLAAVTGAQLWSDLASRLPSWQAQLDAEFLTLRGLVGKPLNAKRASKLVNKGEQPLYACTSAVTAESKAKSEPVVAPQPMLKRQIFTPQGQPLKQPAFATENDYIIVLSAPDVTAGPAEFLVPLPPELRLRAVLPGSPLVGHYNWLKDVDQVLAYRTTPDGLVLALSRPTAGALKVALLVQARGKLTTTWPAPQLAQFNTTRSGTDENLTID